MMKMFDCFFRIRERHDKVVFNSEELETGILLGKEWSKDKNHQAKHQQKVIDRVTKSQERALKKLKEESEELYLKAIEVCLLQLFVFYT